MASASHPIESNMRDGQFFYQRAHHVRSVLSAYLAQLSCHLSSRAKAFGRHNMSATETKDTALITGASAGIGAIYADRLARRGYDLILVARNRNRLAALAQRLRSETGRLIETIAADLNDKVDLARIETTLRANASITLLVNNPGVGATAPLLDSDVEKMDEMIPLNVGALTRLIHAAAPGFVARGGGTIVNIASLNGVYGGSKAFVLALSQSLNHELAGKAVRVQADHVLLPLCAYFASAYGGLRIPSEPIRGGLASWQERRAKEILRARLDGKVSLAELARECELSRSHFARAFKQSIGTSPHRWLLARRAEKAKDLLIRSKLSLAEIALACGFADQSHFTRVFADLVGTSPGAWRRAGS
jgi:NADP-dependent 3-hydroxy acid dehydrogenase YdfG/AraC-like DNA-binding protein